MLWETHVSPSHACGSTGSTDGAVGSGDLGARVSCELRGAFPVGPVWQVRGAVGRNRQLSLLYFTHFLIEILTSMCFVISKLLLKK